MKTTDITINGQKYTLALTKGAFDKLCVITGGTENFAKLFETKTMEEMYSETLKVISALLDGGRDYAALVFEEGQKRLTEKELEILISAGDCLNYRLKALEAVALGLTREVEIEENRKNAETMQKEP